MTNKLIEYWARELIKDPTVQLPLNLSSSEFHKIAKKTIELTQNNDRNTTLTRA